MAQVHTFSLLTSLYGDTRLPLQYPGNGGSPAPRQIELSLLAEWLATQFGIGVAPQTVSTGGTLSVGAGNLLQVIAIKAAVGARTIKIGTTAGGEDILELTSIASGSDFSATVNRYTSSSLTLHFTITGGTADVLLFTQPEA